MGRDHVKPYCLYCYAPFEVTLSGASVSCLECGASNLRADLRLFWTKERDMVQWEQIAKVAIFLLCVGGGSILFFTPGGMGTGQGWAIGAPMLMGAALWETASKLTRKKPYSRAEFFWTWFFLAPVLLLFLFVLMAKGWEAFFILVLGLPAYLAAYLVRRAAMSFERFRVERITSGIFQ